MTFNPSYAELSGRELQRIRFEEAKRERLINMITLANPSTSKKVFLIFRDRWMNFWKQGSKGKISPPISPVPGSSPSR